MPFSRGTDAQGRRLIGGVDGLVLVGSRDERISKEEFERRAIELKRCSEDIDYFVDNYFYIETLDAGKELIKMYPKQREFLHKIRDAKDVICCASRQVGKTTTYAAFCLHYICFNRDKKILLSANKGENAKEFLLKIKTAYEMIPNWIKPRIKEWNKQSVTFENGSRIIAATTTATSGRSGSNNIIILDEFSFVPRNIQEEFINSVMPTLSSSKTAKVIIVSTPNGVGDHFHKFWLDSFKQGTIWVRHKIDWWEVPGRDEAWKQREIRECGSIEGFNQEFGNTFANSVGNKLIPDSILLNYAKDLDTRNPAAIERNVNPADKDCKFVYTEYRPYNPARTYVIGADSSEGTGADAAVAYVFDITYCDNIEMVAKFSSNSVPPTLFAYVLYYMGKAYGFPFIAMERNACGGSVFDSLCTTVFQYPNVISENPQSRPGIYSHPQMKIRACLNAQSITSLCSYHIVINDGQLLEELNSFERKEGTRNATYKAAKGRHDDHVLSFIWALFAMERTMLDRYYLPQWKENEFKQTYAEYVLPASNPDPKRYPNIDVMRQADIAAHGKAFSSLFSSFPNKRTRVSSRPKVDPIFGDVGFDDSPWASPDLALRDLESYLEQNRNDAREERELKEMGYDSGDTQMPNNFFGIGSL